MDSDLDSASFISQNEGCVSLFTITSLFQPLNLLSINLIKLQEQRTEDYSLLRYIIGLITKYHIEVILFQNATKEQLQAFTLSTLKNNWNCCGEESLNLYTFYFNDRLQKTSHFTEYDLPILTTVFFDQKTFRYLSLSNICAFKSAAPFIDIEPDCKQLLTHYLADVEIPVIVGEFNQYIKSTNKAIASVGGFCINRDKELMMLERRLLKPPSKRLAKDCGTLDTFHFLLNLSDTSKDKYQSWLQEHWGKDVYAKAVINSDNQRGLAIVFSQITQSYLLLKRAILLGLANAQIQTIHCKSDEYYCLIAYGHLINPFKDIISTLLLNTLFAKINCKISFKLSSKQPSSTTLIPKSFDIKKYTIETLLFNTKKGDTKAKLSETKKYSLGAQLFQTALNDPTYDSFQKIILLITFMSFKSGYTSIQEDISMLLSGKKALRAGLFILENYLNICFGRSFSEVEPIVQALAELVDNLPEKLPNPLSKIFDSILQRSEISSTEHSALAM